MMHGMYAMLICWELRERISVPMTMENLPEQRGKPILGQINSNELTDILIIVVRYFGGIKLGTSGLIVSMMPKLLRARLEKVETARILDDENIL